MPVVTIINSDDLSKAIDNEDNFQEEYTTIRKYLRDAVETNSDNMELALTLIDTIYIENDTTGFYSKGARLTNERKVEPFFVPGQ